MIDKEKFVTITEAVEITGKSNSTIRRFVGNYSDKKEIIKEELNEFNRPTYYINRQFLLSKFKPEEFLIEKSLENNNNSNSLFEGLSRKQKLFIGGLSIFSIIIFLLLIIITVLFFSFQQKTSNNNLPINNYNALVKELASKGSTAGSAIVPPSRLNPHKFVSQMQAAVDPKSKLRKINTLNIETTVITTKEKDLSKTVKAYRYTYNRKNPELILLECDVSISRENKIEKSKYETMLLNGKFQVIKNEQQLSDNQPEYKFMKALALGYKSNAFFGILSHHDKFKINRRISSIDNINCYEIDVVLASPLWDKSKKVTLFVDCKSYLIKQIDTEYSEIIDIRYKEYEGVKVIDQFIVQDPYENSQVTYVDMNIFQLNKKLDLSRLSRK